MAAERGGGDGRGRDGDARGGGKPTIGYQTLLPRCPFARFTIATAVIDVVTGKHGPLGCAVSCTLPAEAGDSKEARELLAAMFDVLDGAIAERIRTAQVAAEVAAAVDS